MDPFARNFSDSSLKPHATEITQISNSIFCTFENGKGISFSVSSSLSATEFGVYTYVLRSEPSTTQPLDLLHGWRSQFRETCNKFDDCTKTLKRVDLHNLKIDEHSRHIAADQDIRNNASTNLVKNHFRNTDDYFSCSYWSVQKFWRKEFWTAEHLR